MATQVTMIPGEEVQRLRERLVQDLGALALRRDQVKEQLKQVKRQMDGQKGAIDACEFLLKEPEPQPQPAPDEGEDERGV